MYAPTLKNNLKFLFGDLLSPMEAFYQEGGGIFSLYVGSFLGLLLKKNC